MAQRFGMWERLWRSPWSTEAYRDVAAGSIGSAFIYLALWVALAAIVPAARMQWFIGGSTKRIAGMTFGVVVFAWSDLQPQSMRRKKA